MKPIAVIDLETDPFNGSEISPFLSGWYDGKTRAQWWGPRCLEQLVQYIQKRREDFIIYARNGGRFDFFFLLPWIDRREVSIVDSRIVRCYMGRHQLRDSYAIMPFPLRDFEKQPVDYGLFHRDKRESHKAEILNYHASDLENEYALCSRFCAEFGDMLTIGGVSCRELRKRCPFWRGGAAYDAEFRGRYFSGGRNEIFQAGVIDDSLSLYDVVSMYPDVMRNALHPVGTTVEIGKTITEKTVFLTCEGENFGAFGVRMPTGELNFGHTRGVFHVTRHEFEAAEESGTFKCERILETYSWGRLATFLPFVDHYSEKRRKAQRAGDRAGDLIYKHVQNGAYGKFAQNPARYSDYYLTRYGARPAADGPWVPAFVTYAHRAYMLWKKPAQHPVWYNVATAASITGAARAKLLRGLSITSGVLYCDTDSILCRGRSPLADDSGTLGSWRLEVQAARAAMVCKKVYAMFDASGACVKKANAGCILTPEEILRAARGERLEKIDAAPTFSLNGTVRFKSHTIARVQR